MIGKCTLVDEAGEHLSLTNFEKFPPPRLLNYQKIPASTFIPTSTFTDFATFAPPPLTLDACNLKKYKGHEKELLSGFRVFRGSTPVPAPCEKAYVTVVTKQTKG